LELACRDDTDPSPKVQQELFNAELYRASVADPAHPCADCGVHTTPGSGSRHFSRRAAAGAFDGTWEWYMVRDQVWAKAGMPGEGLLCIGCLERCLGRELKREDIPVNDDSSLITERLRSRLEGEPGSGCSSSLQGSNL
jgi:hypothetical protein